MMRTMRPLEAVMEAIRAAKKIALVCHVSPDGDTVGSALAMRLGLIVYYKVCFLPMQSLLFIGD